MQRLEMWMRKPLLPVGKREQATGEIRPGVALEFKDHRFGAALDPDVAAHDSFDAVVDLTAHYAVMDSKGHAPIIPGRARTVTFLSQRPPRFARKFSCPTTNPRSMNRWRMVRGVRRAKYLRAAVTRRCRRPNWTPGNCPAVCGNCFMRPRRAGFSF